MMDISGNVQYIFQPRGLNEDSQPLRRSFVCEARLEFDEADYETVDVPREILGTQVEDMASGFAGIAISIIRHVNGCFHVEIQPPGLTAKGAPIMSHDFDCRQCAGEMIPVLTKGERADSVAERPSPDPFPTRTIPGDGSLIL